jgi:hypothetical protein
MNTTTVLDDGDLQELADTGTLWFPLGDRRIELHTEPRPTPDPLAIHVTGDHLDALREHGRVVFRRDWGRVALTLTRVPAVTR